MSSKLAVEVVIRVGVQPLFLVGGGGGWCSNKMKLALIRTQVEVVVAVGLKKSPENKLSRVGGELLGGGGWVAGSSGNKAISAFN